MIQLEIGGRWQLRPDGQMSWRQWAFDPFFGLTRVGQILKNPRAQIPEGEFYKAVESISGERDPETNLIATTWISRCFWLRFGCRILGLDLGLSIFCKPKVSTP